MAREGGTGWSWFLAWAGVGMLASFSIVASATIGIFFVPLVVLGLVWVRRRSRRMREAIGFAAGIGLTLLVIAFIQRDGNGIDPKPWLVAGLVVLVSAVVAYGAARRQLH